MNPQDTLDQFFIEDKQLMPDCLKIKRSVLLALIEDMKYAVQLPGKWKNLGHTTQQTAHLQTMLPSFTVASLFCTGIDILAKVTQKRTVPPRKNRAFFTGCAHDWFGLDQGESGKLWDLRNSIVHTYKLPLNSVLQQYGHSRVIKRSQSGIWFFYLHSMYSELKKQARNIYDRLSVESQTDKETTHNYLASSGFFYTLV